MSQPAQTVLTLAAVAGRRFDFNLLQQVAHLSEGELLPLLKELIAAQLVVEESADFTDPKIAGRISNFYGKLTQPERTETLSTYF